MRILPDKTVRRIVELQGKDAFLPVPLPIPRVPPQQEDSSYLKYEGAQERVSILLGHRGLDSRDAWNIAGDYGKEMEFALAKRLPIHWWTLTPESAPYVSDGIRRFGNTEIFDGIALRTLPMLAYLHRHHAFTEAGPKTREDLPLVPALAEPEVRRRMIHFLADVPSVDLGNLIWSEIYPLQCAFFAKWQFPESDKRYPHLSQSLDLLREKKEHFLRLLRTSIEAHEDGTAMEPATFRDQVERHARELFDTFEKKPPLRRSFFGFVQDNF